MTSEPVVHEMPVRFVRIGGKDSDGWLSNSYIQRWLWGQQPCGDYELDSQRIGIDFGSFPSFDESDYGGESQVSNFNQMGDEPTIVVVKLSHMDGKYIARTVQGSHKVFVVDTGQQQIVDDAKVSSGERSSSLSGRYESNEYKMLKTLKLENIRKANKEKYEKLWRWQTPLTVHDVGSNGEFKRKFIRTSYLGHDRPYDINSLTEDEELLCVRKWLQDYFEKDRIYNNIENFQIDAPMGNQRESYDIFGSAETESGDIVNVFASVTTASDDYLQPRVRDINSYAERDGEVFLFGQSKTPPDELDERINYISLSEVFDWMGRDGTRQQHTFRTMLSTK